MSEKVSLTYYSDVLCIWAHLAQARIDEVERRFGAAVEIDYRYCSVFGDTEHKIGVGWSDRGGFEGFGKHVCDVANEFDHIRVHADLWKHVRPASSAPAHLLLRAVQRIDEPRACALLREVRAAFFERCQDVSCWAVLSSLLETVGVESDEARSVIDSGIAHADLEADQRDKDVLQVQGSPTLILDGGRQKLYGNVGYRVIEASIEELLRSPKTGSASWC